MTKISWADESWNPIIGCSKISAGCLNCYAEKMAYRLAAMGTPFYDMVQEEGRWNGTTEFVNSALTKPLHWRKPRKIFVCTMSDLFLAPAEWIDRVFAVMALCPQHQFMCLTKRAGRMREYIVDMKTQVRIAGAASQGARTTIDLGRFWGAAGWPIKNVHLGVTVENQDNVGRIADLRATPAAGKFVSLEPCLGGIDFGENGLDGIDKVIVGSESIGRGCGRECKIEWVRDIVQQCRNAKSKIHIKQLSIDNKLLKDINLFPDDLRIRE